MQLATSMKQRLRDRSWASLRFTPLEASVTAKVHACMTCHVGDLLDNVAVWDFVGVHCTACAGIKLSTSQNL